MSSIETGGFLDQQAESERQGVIERITNAGVEESLVSTVNAKIKKAGSAEAVLNEIRELDKKLAGKEDEDIPQAVREYLGNIKQDELDEGEVDKEGWGDDEEI